MRLKQGVAGRRASSVELRPLVYCTYSSLGRRILPLSAVLLLQRKKYTYASSIRQQVF